jgi:hypothetical protein
MEGKSVVFTGISQVQFQEVEVPEPLAHEIVIDVKHSWISIRTEMSYNAQKESLQKQLFDWDHTYEQKQCQNERFCSEH